jgi:hypothetical protein
MCTNLIYSYISLPKYSLHGEIYTMRKGGVFYNVVLAGYVPRFSKGFGVEISKIARNSGNLYKNNDKYSLIYHNDDIYLVETNIYNTSLKKKNYYYFNYDDYSIPEVVYNKYTDKIYSLCMEKYIEV